MFSIIKLRQSNVDINGKNRQVFKTFKIKIYFQNKPTDSSIKLKSHLQSNISAVCLLDLSLEIAFIQTHLWEK